MRWCNRNPAVATLTSAVAVLLVAVTIGASFWAVSANNAAQRDREAAQREKEISEKADQARKLAEDNADANRKRVGEQYVAQGQRLFEQGDTSGALLMFAEALVNDQKDEARAAMHRIRVAMASRQCPRPEQVFFHKDRVNDAVFTRDGKQVVTAGEDGVVQFWDKGTGKPAGSPLMLNHPVTRIAFSPDGRRMLTESRVSPEQLAVSPAGRNIPARIEFQVWDPSKSQSLTPAIEGEDVTPPQFSPDSRSIIGHVKEGVRVWNAHSGEVIKTFKGDFVRVHCTADSQRLLLLPWAASASVAGSGRPGRGTIIERKKDSGGARIAQTARGKKGSDSCRTIDSGSTGRHWDR